MVFKNQLLLAIIFVLGASLQNLKAQEGTVNIIQDTKITKLLEYKKDPRIVDLYRIQIYTGSRKTAFEKLEEFKTVFPDIETTILYDTPNYKIWVGGYRTRLEVDNALVAIKKEFPAAFKTKPIQKIE